MNRFHKVKMISDYGTTYQLNGRTIRDKDKLVLRFPDGSKFGPVAVQVKTHVDRGFGGMSETTSWDELRVRMFWHDLDTWIVIPEGMEARFA